MEASMGQRVKDRLRPTVYRFRRLRERLGRFLRPPRPWDGRHHPVLERFRPWEGEADGRFIHDFLGVRTDPRFRIEFKPDQPGHLATNYPDPDWTYFETIFVLESVIDSADAGRPSYAMMELGAGFGPWMATTHVAMRRLSAKPIHLTGVEMEPHRFDWISEHLSNNGIRPSEHRLIHAAVSDREGEGVFHSRSSPDLDYGLRLSHRAPGSSPDPGHVRCVSLAGLLDEVEAVDLIHVDVQGEEWRALHPAAGALTAKVRRIIVATHSRSIHRKLRRLFVDAGWRCRWEFRLRKRERTEFGDVQFLDGLLAFVNPAAGRVH